MPTVRLFTCFLQLLTGLALPAPQWALSPGNISSAVEVVPFEQVWSRSYCRPVERLVDIVSEYPSEVEHMFSPSCVSLMRCTGCCSDETMHCMPLETANVTMQLMKYHSLDQPFFVEMSFSQHVRCECKWVLGCGRDSPHAPGGISQTSAREDEAKKEEIQGQGPEEERGAETQRLSPVR